MTPSASFCSTKLVFEDMPLTTIYPGHGPAIQGASQALAKVDEYLSHRQLREDQLLAVLGAQIGTSTTTWDLVDKIYTTPKLTSFFVRVSAQFNIHHHLEKLLAENKVSKVWPDSWRLKT